MSVANSRNYGIGRDDALADMKRISQCPPQPAIGPVPNDPDYPRMYNRGYEETFDATAAHICTESCKK